MAENDKVTISRAEFGRLVAAVEDLEDLRVVEYARRNAKDGVLHALVVRLVAGESRVRLFREWRGPSGAARRGQRGAAPGHRERPQARLGGHAEEAGGSARRHAGRHRLRVGCARAGEPMARVATEVNGVPSAQGVARWIRVRPCGAGPYRLA